MNTRWRYGVLIGTLLALLSLYPQAVLIYERGSEYNGSASVSDNDESEYIAYLQALIDGRPRKNNIYVGGTELPPETRHSVQALPAYAAAIPARITGVSAERLFPLLSVICAFGTAICLFWLLHKVTENSAFAAAAAIFVLVMGVSVAGYGAAKYYLGLGSASAALPFLRRYTPSLAFPFVFLILGLIWQAHRSPDPRKKLIYSVATSLCFSVLLYSYFYLWTAALALMMTLALVTIVLRIPSRRSHIWQFWLPSFLLIALFSTPYFVLLTQISESTDDAQGLERTRQLVLTRPAIWIGLLILLVLAWCVRSERMRLDRPSTHIIIGLALLPLIVFNQHIITGYSLQPFHYNLYVAPYLVLLSGALLVWELSRDRISKFRPGVWVCVITAFAAWGLVEAQHTTQYRFQGNIQRDKGMPVARRLAGIGRGDLETGSFGVTFNADLFQADNQPAVAPQGVLWSEHLPWASAFSGTEARRRYFLHMYYSGEDASGLREGLKQCPGGAHCKPLFGWRVIPTLSIGSYPPPDEEIEGIVAEYDRFYSEFSAVEAADPTLSFAVIPASADTPENLDRWYKRDSGEVHGDYILYRLTPVYRNELPD